MRLRFVDLEAARVKRAAVDRTSAHRQETRTVVALKSASGVDVSAALVGTTLSCVHARRKSPLLFCRSGDSIGDLNDVK